MMRPFDDDDEEEDSEEEDLIVYKEKEGPAFSLSQLTQKKSQQHNQSQQSLSPPRRPRIIPRHERRKRRNYWKEQQRLDQEAYFNSPSLTAPEESQDAFESVKDLLPDSQNVTPTPKPVKSQRAENEKENIKQIPRNVKASGSKRVERAIFDDDDESTGNFSAANDDQESHDDQQPARQSINKSIPQEEANATREVSMIQDDEEPIIYDERLSEKSNLRSGFESDNEPLSPIRQRKRRRKSRDSHGKHRDKSPGSQLRQSSKSKRKTLRQLTPWGSATQSLTQTQRVKSIVGSRPTSWRKEPEKPLEWKQPRASQKRSSSSRSRQTSTQTAPSMSQIRAKYMPQPKRTRPISSSSSISTTQRSTSIPRATAPSSQRTSSSDRSKPPVSFTPSFLPTSKRRTEDDDVEEVPERALQRLAHTSPVQQQPTSPLMQDASHFSPMPVRNNRRTKKTIGPWQRRLEALQSARSNDAIRLQNEAFRRHKSSFDLQDYRKKSRSHTDITILGDCAGSANSSSLKTNKALQDPSAKLSVLVYIHSHTEHGEPQQQPTFTYSSPQDQPNLQDQLAWCTFTFLTARSINLQKGKQLRLYNSIILPCPQPTNVEGLQALDSLQNNVCERIIVSTWLCENHPGGLPKLSLGSASKEQAAAPTEKLLVGNCCRKSICSFGSTSSDPRPSNSPVFISAGGPKAALPGPKVSKSDSTKKRDRFRFRKTGTLKNFEFLANQFGSFNVSKGSYGLRHGETGSLM